MITGIRRPSSKVAIVQEGMAIEYPLRFPKKIERDMMVGDAASEGGKRVWLATRTTGKSMSTRQKATVDLVLKSLNINRCLGDVEARRSWTFSTKLQYSDNCCSAAGGRSKTPRDQSVLQAQPCELNHLPLAVPVFGA
jgi:hypothetical protein